MNNKDLLDQVLALLYQIKDDESKLKKLHAFLAEEIYPEKEDGLFEEADDEEPIDIPEKYQKLVKEVADLVDAGLVCFINLDTLAYEYLPKEMFYGEFDDGEDTLQEILDRIETEWEHTVQIDPPESNIGYNIMADFTARKVKDKSLKLQLENALNKRKPFRNFKDIVESSALREEWFDFKQKEMEKYVWEELEAYV